MTPNANFKAPGELTEDQIDELKAKHGDNLHMIRTDDDDMIVAKPPTKGTYDKYKAALFDNQKKTRAGEFLVRDCLVFPDKQTFAAMLEEKPALAETFSQKLLELAGARESVEAKKL